MTRLEHDAGQDDRGRRAWRTVTAPDREQEEAAARMAMPASPAGAPPRPAVTWSWDRALAGAVYAIPSALVTLHDPAQGIPLAVGVLPAAIMPIPARRAARVVILVVGVLAGASLFLGGVIAHLPTAATAALLMVAVVAGALLASLSALGRIVLVLCVPLVAAGLSYSDYATSAEAFLLLSAGAAYAWLVSLAWPDREAPPRPAPVLPSRLAMAGYGVRIGIAAALAYLVAAGLELDHAGWAPAACLLVARPQVGLLQSRGLGRILSVVAGALLAAVLLRADPPLLAYSVVAVVVLAAAAATAGSRWYITSAFTTFFVFLMLLNGRPDQTTGAFDERVGETLLGVALAYVFGGVLTQGHTAPPPGEDRAQRS